MLQFLVVIPALLLAGLAVLAGAALRGGLKTNRWNPTFAFLFMFCTGLIHGLHPGLSLQASLRSLVGSAAPFLFSFVRLDETFRSRAVAALIGFYATVLELADKPRPGMAAMAGLNFVTILLTGARALGAGGHDAAGAAAFAKAADGAGRGRGASVCGGAGLRAIWVLAGGGPY